MLPVVALAVKGGLVVMNLPLYLQSVCAMVYSLSMRVVYVLAAGSRDRYGRCLCDYVARSCTLLESVTGGGT